MGRAKRNFAGNQVYHVLNRGNGKGEIFENTDDYVAFERILREAVERFSMRLAMYTVGKPFAFGTLVNKFTVEFAMAVSMLGCCEGSCTPSAILHMPKP